jgi:hypothetical protein
MNMTTAERNEIDRQWQTLSANDRNAGLGWDEGEALEQMRQVCTVAEKYGTLVHNDGQIFRTTVLQFHDRQDMIDFYECELRLKEDIEVDYRVLVHLDRMTIEIERQVNFLDHVDAIKAYYNEDEEVDWSKPLGDELDPPYDYDAHEGDEEE